MRIAQDYYFDMHTKSIFAAKVFSPKFCSKDIVFNNGMQTKLSYRNNFL